MTLVELVRRRDPRGMPVFLHKMELRHHPERVWDAAFRERLKALTDAEICELAGDPACLYWLGANKVRQLLCVIVRRQLDPDCLDPSFITIVKETA